MNFCKTSKIDGKCIVVTLENGSKRQELPLEVKGQWAGEAARIEAMRQAKAIVDAKLAETPDARQFGQWMKDNGMKVRV